MPGLLAASQGNEKRPHTSSRSDAVTRRARKLNPALRIVARAHSEEEAADFKRWGADLVVLAEEETAAKMAEKATS